MSLGLSIRRICRLALAVGLTIITVFALAPPAQASAVVVPYRGWCIVDNREVTFDIWVRVYAGYFSVDRFAWDTRRFTPSRMAVSLKHEDGGTPLIGSWGNSASTLHDVSARGDTGPNWSTELWSTANIRGIFGRVYLNENESCPSSPYAPVDAA